VEVFLAALVEGSIIIKIAWRRFFNIVFLLGLFFTADCLPSFAQNTPITLTLLYTNNIWGEIDPCPV